MSTDLDQVEAEPVGFLNVQTGEWLEPTVENAAQALLACRAMKEHVNDLVTEITGYVLGEAERRGTKTLPADENTAVVLSGGTSTEFDAVDLMELLRSAGCPEDRIDAAVKTEITYKVNRSVLKQLAVNPDYKAAIELAQRDVEKPYRAYVRDRRTK